MIKNIFLPRNIGNYYLFAERRLGFDIGKTHINVTKLHLNGTTITLEKFLHEKIDQSAGSTHQQRVNETIKNIVKKIGKYTHVYSALSSSHTVFKELTLPFTSHQKIAMTLPFEIEQYLPFSLDQAVIDFIITDVDTKKQQSKILVAAVLHEHIEHHLQFFEDTGITPSVINIDLFALYGLYTTVHPQAPRGSSALLDIGYHTTSLAYLVDGKLKALRSIPQGIVTITKKVSDALNSSQEQVMEQLLRFGLEENDGSQFGKKLQEAFMDYFTSIQFTLNSFATHHPTDHAFNGIHIVGDGGSIAGLTSFVSQQLGVSCSLLDTKKLTSLKNVKIKQGTTLPAANIMSTSVAFPSSLTESFNLLRNHFAPSTTPLLNKQIVAGLTLITLILVGLGVNSFLRLQGLQQEVEKLRTSTIKRVEREIPTLEKGSQKVATVIDEAEREIDKEEKIWFALSSQNRHSFLRYLQELSSIIDRESLGLVLKKMHLTENSITLDGSVKTFESLRILEEELNKSQLFSRVSKPQDTTFVIEITLEKNNGDE